MAGLTLQIVGTDVIAAVDWKSVRYTESIGTPDEMSCDAVGFTTDPIFTQPVQDLFFNPYNFFYACLRLDYDILFSGVIRPITKAKPTRGAVIYSLSASGWQFLMPKRLVGTPTGMTWFIDPYDPDPLPTPVDTDPNATASPTAAGVASLFGAYWNTPPIDVTTFVMDPGSPSSSDDISWSGSDLEGAINDLTHAASASCLWWFANDSPNYGHIFAPHLAFHWGVVILPDEGDGGDDLLAGFPSADQPSNVAPYEISDEADGVTSILPLSSSFTIDHSGRSDGAYVRGATGYILPILPVDGGGYTIGEVQKGGTGWVQSPGGLWGEEYVDAPAAITSEQRDAFGQATIAAKQIPAWTGTVNVVGYDGWHKGQAVAVTDADYGFDHRWFLIRAVSMQQHDPQSLANEYTLTLGDVLSPSLGYALRNQRLKEARKEIAPATQFIAYMGDLQPAPGDTLIVRMQLATDSGAERRVAGVTARWSLIINGDWAADPFSTANLFWLSDQTTVTNEIGQVTATMHAAAGATPDADAANVKADVML